ncbi:hypothetical protein BpHYR1_044968 [Brachionus plicatilis]|uniref:Uncharacterized protein n=1 Tax=Brachionus plicatilis TaxID=10195 RepID=A0A3M7P882_BRAPC|nr:hypothetical protein BpHYR1_044968 [Brachionus plicatilis]
MEDHKNFYLILNCCKNIFSSHLSLLNMVVRWQNIFFSLKNISSENIPFLYTLVENYFKTINSIKNTSAHTEDKVHRPQIVAKVKINNLITNCSKDPEVLPRQKITCHERTNKLTFRFVAQFVLKTLKYRNFLLYKEKKTIKLSEKFRASLKTFENKSLDMSPECENRSIQIKDDKELEPYLQEKHS